MKTVQLISQKYRESQDYYGQLSANKLENLKEMNKSSHQISLVNSTKHLKD